MLKKIKICLIVAMILLLTLSLAYASNIKETSLQMLIATDPTRNVSKVKLLTPNGDVPVCDESNIITNNTIILNSSRGSRSSGGDVETKMTLEQYQKIEDVATKGNILITKDNTTLGVNHGHAGIVYENCTSTVEALGYGEVSQKQNLSTWKEHYQVRLYYPSNVSESNRYAAGDYAHTSLRGWSYQLLPSVNSDSNLNCATLVWKAYKHGANHSFSYNEADTVTPQNIVDWWGLTQKVSINWNGTGW